MVVHLGPAVRVVLTAVVAVAVVVVEAENFGSGID